MSDPNPLDNEELFDSIILGNVRSPGKVTLSGHDRKVGWDVKKGNAQQGASMSRTSEDPVVFAARFELSRDEATGVDEIAEWPAFAALIRSTVAGATPIALDIYHPDLIENGIKSVVLDTFCGCVHDGKGGQIRTVKLSEYFPPKPKGGSPNGSRSSPKPKRDDTDPNAKAKGELADLINQYKATPWG